MGEDDMAEMDPLHSPFPLSHWPRGRGKQINNLLCSSAQRQKASLRGERVRTSQPQSLVFAQKKEKEKSRSFQFGTREIFPRFLSGTAWACT